MRSVSLVPSLRSSSRTCSTSGDEIETQPNAACPVIDTISDADCPRCDGDASLHGPRRALDDNRVLTGCNVRQRDRRHTARLAVDRHASAGRLGSDDKLA